MDLGQGKESTSKMVYWEKNVAQCLHIYQEKVLDLCCELVMNVSSNVFPGSSGQ